MGKQIRTVEGYERPRGNRTIWRYMGLEKFLHLITTNQLYFCRASEMTDKRELSLPLNQEEAQQEKLMSTDMRAYLSDRTHYDRIAKMRARVDELKTRIYLNSWSIAKHESYALWKIYLGGSRAGIAIKSTVSSLLNAMTDLKRTDVQVASVNYTDYVRELALRDEDYILNKSQHYDFERELRLYIDQAPIPFDPNMPQPMQTYGIPIKVDLNVLIKEIYLSPFAMGGFRKTFEDAIRKINPEVNAKIFTSAVRDS